MARVWHPSPFRRTTEVHAALRRCLHLGHTGSTSLMGCRDRLEAREPGGRKPVKAASRRSRARAARALTGSRPPGNGWLQAAWLGAADEVRDSMILHRLAPNRRLRAKSAPRCNELILLPSSTHRPERTSRLLSCHRPVGGLRLAVPARSLAKLRSNKSSDPYLGSKFRVGSLQSTCLIFGDRTCAMCHQIGLCQDAGAAAAVPIVCRADARSG